VVTRSPQTFLTALRMRSLSSIKLHTALLHKSAPGTLDLPRLEHRVAIGEDYRRTPLLEVHRVAKQTLLGGMKAVACSVRIRSPKQTHLKEIRDLPCRKSTRWEGA
jgi:hypothetical protein